MVLTRQGQYLDIRVMRSLDRSRWSEARLRWTFLAVRATDRAVTGGRWCNRFVPEESPNTRRQHASRKAREFGAKAPRDGKYHRKYTAPHHFWTQRNCEIESALTPKSGAGQG